MHRVAHLIGRGADPRRILLLTFTRRASAEMLRRVDSLLAAEAVGHGHARERVWGGTFHAIAARLLRIHARDLGMEPDFTILDRSDSEDLLHVERTALGLGRDGPRFPQKATCLDIYSRCVNAQAPLPDVLRVAFPWCEVAEEGLGRLFARYTDAKEEQQVLDYDDLLLFWRALLADPVAGGRVRERFDHVLVDEYQDTNALQAEIVALLRPGGRGVTCVGDDAQAIYSFRAATVRNIFDFELRFPGADGAHPHAQLPLHAAHPGGDQRRHRRGGRAPRKGALDRTLRRRPAAARHLPRRRRADGLARATASSNTASRARRSPPRRCCFAPSITRCCSRSSSRAATSPFASTAGCASSRWPTSKTWSLFCAWPRTRATPWPACACWASYPASARPPRPRSARPLAASGGDFAAWAGVKVPEPARGAWPAVVALLRGLAGAAPGEVPAQVQAVRIVYQPLLERRYDNAPRAPARPRTDRGSSPRGRATVRQFLADLVLDPPAYTQELAGPPLLDEDYLILSTMHSAKGLEFDVVYVMHAADGNIPSDMATGSTDEIEEERRLFYVACTRARDTLYVTHPLRYYTQPWAKADTHGYAQRSRFLSEAVVAHFTQEQAVPEPVGTDGAPLERTSSASIRAGIRSLWE